MTTDFPPQQPTSDFQEKLKKQRRRKILWSIFFILLAILILGAAFVFAWFAKDLPSPSKLTSREVPQATQIFDRHGKLLYQIHGEYNRISIPFSEMPQSIKHAIISIEDVNFYKHEGFDLKGIIRSIIYNILYKTQIYGGSTITQQLIKNTLLSPERTIKRKIKEIILAIETEIRYSKDQILEMYLNQIPFGSNTYGIEAASQVFFGKKAKKLTVAEAATLAALPRAPTYYSPYGPHKDELLKRKDYILKRMYNFGFISKDEYEKAKKEKIKFKPYREEILAPHFVMYVREYLAEKYGQRMLEEGGLRVTTTLDYEKQKIAEAIVKKHVNKNGPLYHATNAALVAIDAKTGEILAMVGSKDYWDTKIDGNVNVTIRDRQPGSAIKPIIYAAAFEKGYNPATMIIDVPTDFGNNYKPTNYTKINYGIVNPRKALAGSLNVPSVKLLAMTGLDNALNLAHEMGITTLNEPERYGLTLVLGGGEVKLLELTNAFTVFARGGTYLPTISIIKVEDSKGTILEEKPSLEPKQVLNEGVAYQINSILSDNVSRSFIFGSTGPLIIPGHTVAVKTGTTNDSRDGWCIGYTPSLAVGVWSGNNDNTPMTTGVASYYTSAPLWNEFMSEMLKNKPDEPFKKPKNIVTLEVDALTGLLPTKNCPGPFKKEIFVKNLNEPTEKCDKVYTTVKIDKISGKLATELTPEATIIEKTFIVIHSEFPDRPNWENPVVAWAKKNGYYNPPPTEEDDIHIEKNKPTVTITSPENGGLVSGNFNIEVSATAPKGVKEIAFYIDNILVKKVTSPPFSITYNTGAKSGNKIIKVVLTDKIYFTAEATISVTFARDTQPPNEVSNLTANAESKKVILSWINPPDFDLSKIYIYRGTEANFEPSNENKIAQISAIPNKNGSFIDTTVTSGITYYYIIKTVDLNGNLSVGASISVIVPE